eukprot:jgi/Botrbrau1/3700/Bobra.0008s0027.1
MFCHYYNNNIIDKTDVLGEVTDRAHVEEAQKRGTPHRHSLLWVKDSPKFDQDDPTKDAACEDFIDQYITTDLRSLPEHLRTLHTHVCARGKCLNKKGDCRFNAPWYPMRRSRILRSLHLPEDEAKAAAQDLKRIHAVLARLDAVLRSKEALSGEDEALAQVTFDQFLAACAVTEADYERAIAAALNRPAVVFYKRQPQHIRVNTFNAKITSVWEAHTDVQFILDEHACVQYLTSYMLKGDRRISQALHDIISKARGMTIWQLQSGDQFREYVRNRRRFNGPDLCLADYALRYSPPCKKRKTSDASDHDNSSDAPDADEPDSDSSNQMTQGNGNDTAAAADPDSQGLVYPPKLTQRHGFCKHLRLRPCIPRFSILPSPTSIEEECRTMIMLFAPGSAWATQTEAEEDIALLGGCSSYAVRYMQLQEHIDRLGRGAQIQGLN